MAKKTIIVPRGKTLVLAAAAFFGLRHAMDPALPQERAANRFLGTAFLTWLKVLLGFKFWYYVRGDDRPVWF